jgi:hypothetical protein
MTHEEFAVELQHLYEDWERTEMPKHCPGFLFTENNLIRVGHVIGQHVRYTRALPNVRELTGLIKSLGDIQAGGKLEFHHASQVIVQQAAPAPPPPNPADNLPFAEIKELSFLKTAEDVQRFEARVERDGLSYMSGFKRLRRNSTKDYEELNARIAYIKEHNLRAPKPIAAPKQVVTIPAPIAEARKLVDSMTLQDVGQTGSSGGRRTLLANKQKRLHTEINQMSSNGKKPSVIIQWVTDEIKRFGESSIR